MDELRFDGRTVIVTGAGRGLGRRYALDFAARGARIVVADDGSDELGFGSSSEPADAVVAEITDAGGSAVAFRASVAGSESAAEVVDAAVEAFGGLDVVVNNAGFSNLGAFEEISIERWQHMLDVQYLGPVRLLKAAWPVMAAAGYGRVINTISESVLGNVPRNSSHSSTTAAVLGLTRSLALEGAPMGIRVNAIAPRADTRLSAPHILSTIWGLPPDTFKGVMDSMRPELVSAVVLYLAHESCDLTGETLIAGGGQVMRMAYVENEGITRDDLSPEIVAENLDAVMDLSAANVVRVQTTRDLP